MHSLLCRGLNQFEPVKVEGGVRIGAKGPALGLGHQRKTLAQEALGMMTDNVIFWKPVKLPPAGKMRGLNAARLHSQHRLAQLDQNSGAFDERGSVGWSLMSRGIK